MMHFYVKLNDENIVVSTQESIKPIEAFGLIETDRPINIGMKYQDGEFIEYTPPPKPVLMTAVEFQEHVRNVVGDASFVDWLDSTAPTIRADRHILSAASVVSKENALTLSALDNLVTNGILTEIQKQSVLDDWLVS